MYYVRLSNRELHVMRCGYVVAGALGLLLLAGCGSHSSNLQVGNEQSYASLKDQRAPVLTSLSRMTLRSRTTPLRSPHGITWANS